MHANDTPRYSKREINSQSESSNKGILKTVKNNSIVEDSIFSDISDTIKNERTEAKKKKGGKRKRNKRKDSESEKQTTTNKEEASNQEKPYQK